VATITLTQAQGGPFPQAAVYLPNRVRTEAEILNVLLIEDNESNVKLFQSIFRSRPQCNLVVCRTGRSGLESARDVRPELVLLDAQLPDVVGTSLLEELKREPSLADSKVVIVSADADPLVQDRFLRAGATAFLTKPLDVGQFYALIDSVKEGAKR
jgi:CheY-like chemotaxis protein